MKTEKTATEVRQIEEMVRLLRDDELLRWEPHQWAQYNPIHRAIMSRSELAKSVDDAKARLLERINKGASLEEQRMLQREVECKAEALWKYEKRNGEAPNPVFFVPNPAWQNAPFEFKMPNIPALDSTQQNRLYNLLRVLLERLNGSVEVSIEELNKPVTAAVVLSRYTLDGMTFYLKGHDPIEKSTPSEPPKDVDPKYYGTPSTEQSPPSPDSTSPASSNP